MRQGGQELGVKQSLVLVSCQMCEDADYQAGGAWHRPVGLRWPRSRGGGGDALDTVVVVRGRAMGTPL